MTIGAVTRRLRAPTLEWLFVATLVVFGFRLGARPIGDNSMLTHLRTGADLVAGHGIPRVDPYTFTAAGQRWVVQSWLPEWTYGWADRIGGGRLIVLEQAVVTALLALLVVRLARAGSPLRTGLAGTVAVGIGAAYWSPRPLLFGLVCMALLLTIVERHRSPWLLVPLVWLWVQSHGSFPLGLAWLGARAAGEALDWRAWPRETSTYIGGFVAGLVVSIVNPLGLRILAFPLTLGEKQGIFKGVVEWMSPNFQSSSGRIALVCLAVALAVLVRYRLPWRDVVPAVVFIAAGLVAVRNLPVTAVVLAPCLGRALRRHESSPRAPTAAVPPERLRLHRIVLGSLGVLFVGIGFSIVNESPLTLDAYPVSTVTFLEHRQLLGPGHRLAHQDFVGNYLTLRYGRTVKTFYDDRVDMFPVRVSEDYRHLLFGRSDALAILDRRGIDVVLWSQRLALSTILQDSPAWQQIRRSGEWVVFQRVPPGPAAPKAP